MPESTTSRPPAPGWSTWPEGFTLVLRGATFPTAFHVAANFAIPYVVASIGYLAPLRRRP